MKTFDGEGSNYHLTLLVETPEGYRNLAQLVSESIPLDDPEVFRLFSEGKTDGVYKAA